MMFRKYEKIHRLGKEEVEGILEGTVYIQEKIDGANTSIWLNENGWLVCASRNQIIKDGFNGFVDYLLDGPQGANIHSLLKNSPEFRLYGEWLVHHTNHYHEYAYKQWYMFDIWDGVDKKYLPTHEVRKLAEVYNINEPAFFGVFSNPSEEQLKEYVGQSSIGNKGEGIVIKNPSFINKFGDRVCAKLVRQEFMEDNALLFGSNNKHSEAYIEMYIVNKWMQKPRVEKIINKLQPEIDEKLDLKHIPRITNTAYHDLITEEAWEIAKLNREVDYKKLKGLALKKAKLLYMELLGG